MSVYLVNKILYLTDNDADFRKRMREDAEGTVKSLLFRSVRKLRGRLSHYREEFGLEDSQ